MRYPIGLYYSFLFSTSNSQKHEINSFMKMRSTATQAPIWWCAKATAKKRSLKLWRKKRRREKQTAAEIIRHWSTNSRDEYAHIRKWKNVISFGTIFHFDFSSIDASSSVLHSYSMVQRCFFLCYNHRVDCDSIFFFSPSTVEYHFYQLLINGMVIFDWALSCQLSDVINARFRLMNTGPWVSQSRVEFFITQDN